MKKRKSLKGWFKESGTYLWARRHRFTERDFEPYAKSIGQLLLAWNDLHERLATLFVTTMGGDSNLPLGIWHSIRSDVGKRNLLHIAVAKLAPKAIGDRDGLVTEIEWVIGQAHKLEGARDDSVHTPLDYAKFYPLTALLGGDISPMGSKVFPDTAFSNPRAARLRQTKNDLLIEFRYARERIIMLRDYVVAIEIAWSNASLPWPDRPQLPERKPKMGRRPRVAGR